MPRRPRRAPGTVNAWRVEFCRVTRKAGVDILQAGNYFDRGEYDKAFDNAEAAAKGILEELKMLKGLVDARRPKSR